MKGRALAAALFTLILLIASISPAAARPRVTTAEDSVIFSEECDGFEALFDEVISSRITTFAEGNNNPNDYVAQFRIRGSITNSVTGLSVEERTVLNFRGALPALDDVDETRHGVFTKISLPGQGVVTIAAGTITSDENGNAIFAAGTGVEPLIADGFVALVCEALSSLN